MSLVKVRDRRTGIERSVTQTAFKLLGEKRYVRLGIVDEEGNELDSPKTNPQPQIVSVKAAKPAESDAVEKINSQAAEIEVLKRQLAEKKKTSADPAAKDDQRVKNKPGPKPKPQSISHDPSNTNGQN